MADNEDMRNIVAALIVLVSESLAYSDSTTSHKVIIQQGRFQLLQLSDFRRDQFMLDTQTGRVWQSVCAEKKDGGDCAEIQWQELEVQNITPRQRSRQNNKNGEDKVLREEYKEYLKKAGN